MASVIDDIGAMWRSPLMQTMRTTRDWEGVAASLGTYERWYQDASAAIQRLEQELPMEQRRLEAALQQLDEMRDLVNELPNRIAEARQEAMRIAAENAREEREGINRFSDDRPITAKGAHSVYSGR